MQVTKLDGRHRGQGKFKYRVWINGIHSVRLANLLEIREWCWQVWGPSCEREIFIDLDKPYNPYWAWHTGEDAANNDCYIYLTNDEALAFFKLKWM